MLGQGAGYGVQGVVLSRALVEAGHQVVVIPWNVRAASFTEGPLEPAARAVARLRAAGLHIDAFDPTGIEILRPPVPTWPSKISMDVFNLAILQARADVVLILQDMFVFQGDRRCCRPSILWMPCHFQPLEAQALRAMQGFDWILPMSDFGRWLASQPSARRLLTRQRILPMIPHAVSGMRPLHDSKERIAARMRWGWPLGAFVTLIVAANTEPSGRKALELQLQAWVRFARIERPDLPHWLHIHSNIDGGAFDFVRVLELLGEMPPGTRPLLPGDPAEHTKAAPSIRGPRFSVTPLKQYMRLPHGDLATLYGAADVLLAGAAAEGFGVPIIEAQMCGTPVVANATTAMPENVHLGYCAEPAFPVLRPDFNSFWFLPDPKTLAHQLARVSRWTADELAERRAACARVVARKFSEASVGSQIVALVERAAREIPPRRSRPVLERTLAARARAEQLSQSLQPAAAQARAALQKVVELSQRLRVLQSLQTSEIAHEPRASLRPPEAAAVGRNGTRRPPASMVRGAAAQRQQRGRR